MPKPSPRLPRAGGGWVAVVWDGGWSLVSLASLGSGVPILYTVVGVLGFLCVLAIPGVLGFPSFLGSLGSLESLVSPGSQRP